MKLIKRYRNRRLYDAESSRTITLEDLSEMIKKGYEVKVVDSVTDEDITLSVMGRILVMDLTRWGDLGKSKELMRTIISLGGDKSMSLLKNTVLASIGVIQVTKAKAEKIIDDLIKKGELDKSSRKKAVMELLEKAEKSTADFRARLAKEADKAQKGVSKLTRELNWARQTDVKKLEEKVNKLAKAIKEMEKKIGGQS
ncbi:MAG: polyhydroxyalkanoate synthesis regulator DNA-binding domain-containing protein [Candidatus Zixiibacteriota bacterium]